MNIKNILKFTLALGLILWLFKSGKINLNLIEESINNGYFFATFFLLIIQVLLGVWRYKWLLETKSKGPVPFLKLAPLNWIGLFFSSILPGAVTGDLVKVFYLQKIDPHFNKTFLITSTLVDRVMGLSGLLFLSGIFSILNFNSKLQSIMVINFLLFFGTIAFFILLFSSEKWQKRMAGIVLKIPVIGKKIFHLLEQFFHMGKDRTILIKCFFISVAIQFISVYSFWMITHSYYNNLVSLPQAFTFIPIGLIAIAIPISPAGLGVGHALFENLFSMLHVSHGASLFNLFFLCNLIVNLLGSIPYILNKEPLT